MKERSLISNMSELETTSSVYLQMKFWTEQENAKYFWADLQRWKEVYVLWVAKLLLLFSLNPRTDSSLI